MNTQIDKSKELTASISLINNKLLFNGTVEGNQPVKIDYVPPFGDNMGYTSLELLLLSLSSCVASGILVILRKMNKSIINFDIQSKGFRKEEHPTCFKTIVLTINIESSNISEDEMKKAIGLSDKICPVLAMLKGNVEIIQEFKIIK